MPKLTPAQDQMLDLLVARHRLGEPFWPISNELRRTANTLEAKGYIQILHGHVEGTFRARLTDKAMKKFVTGSDYLSPVTRDAAAKVADYVEEIGQPVVATAIRKKFVSH